MLNNTIPTTTQNSFTKPSSLKSQPNRNLQFGMTAKTPTEQEKQTATRLQNHGNRVIADKVNDIWKIVCRCGHQVLGRSGGDLQEISGKASSHKH